MTAPCLSRPPRAALTQSKVAHPKVFATRFSNIRMRGGGGDGSRGPPWFGARLVVALSAPHASVSGSRALAFRPPWRSRS